jgi:hypothetical protein
VKTTGKRASVVGAVMFCLRSGLKSEWIDIDLPDNTAGWRSDWFYVTDQLSALPKRTRHKPVKIPEWDLGCLHVKRTTLRRFLYWSRTSKREA